MWFTFANFLNLGVSILTTPIFTRLLNETEMGKVSLYNTWSSIFTILITLNLAQGVYEVCLMDYEEDKNDMTASLVMVTILLTSIAAILISIFSGPLAQLVGIEKKFFMIMLPEMACTSIVTFWLTKNRFIFNYKSCVIASSFSSVVRAIASLVLVMNVDADKVFLKVLGNALPNYILGVVLGVIIFKESSSRFKIQYWKFAIKFNIVMIPHYLSGILLSSSDRIMIAKMIGNHKVGIYSIAYTCASLISILFASINSVFTPYTYRALKTKNFMGLRKKTNQLIVLTLGCALGLIMIAPEVIRVFAPPSYQEGVWIIPPITAGVYMTFFYSLFSTIEFYYKKNKFITMATIVGAGINIILNIIFIPIFGYRAAAYTTFIGYSIMACGHYWFYKKIMPVEIYDIKYMVKCLSVFLLSTAVIMALYPYPVIRYILTMIVVSVVIINREKIMGIVKSMQNLE